ncbi:hypothetical protein Dxin01_02881 [Deinococcus xinjiangensis]|uniref:Uncharacterized protein n=1 Tax=Deinococcus xinjiangensis TaxID=457454 RepID=A0ABP9VD25_9DEIO
MKIIKGWYQLWSDRLGDFVSDAHFDYQSAAYLEEVKQALSQDILRHDEYVKEIYPDEMGVEELHHFRSTGLDAVWSSYWVARLAIEDIRWVKVNLCITTEVGA